MPDCVTVKVMLLSKCLVSFGFVASIRDVTVFVMFRAAYKMPRNNKLLQL